ncbi:MAG: hypothetical protein K0S93_1120 [Nitrososphaeraceae archaeon]|nr:hypothetical protein [Nitrososphaeraceae archaeon]
MGTIVLNGFFFTALFLFLLIIAIFPTTNVFTQEDGFIEIFPQNYYDPSDYGEKEEQTIPANFAQNSTSKGTIPEKKDENSTSKELPAVATNGTKPQNHLSDIESQDVNFIAAGDWTCNKETEKTVGKITKFKPELVVGLGDYTFEEVSPQCWFDISEPIDNILKIAIGNHDLDYQNSYNQLLEHYNLSEPYYSFNFKNIHFLAISSEHPFDKGSKQYKFITNDLEESLQDPSILWRIVFLHKPMYSSADFDEKQSEDLTNTFHELFESNQVDLVLSGHTQYYQRSLPLLYNNNNPLSPIVIDKNNNEHTNQNGIIFVTAGTAGDELHDIENLLPYYVIQEKQYGFLNFDLKNNGQTLIGTFHDTNDENILDKFVILKDSTGKKTYSQENFGATNNNIYSASGKDQTELSNKQQNFLSTNFKENDQSKLKS